MRPDPRNTMIPVYGVSWDESEFGVAEAMHEAQARMDDAYWARFIRGPFSWSRFTTWWVARRWVRPRDITKG